MSGLETNFKSTRPRPGHYKTKTETASERPRRRPDRDPENWSQDLHHCYVRRSIILNSTTHFKKNLQLAKPQKGPSRRSRNIQLKHSRF